MAAKSKTEMRSYSIVLASGNSISGKAPADTPVEEIIRSKDGVTWLCDSNSTIFLKSDAISAIIWYNPGE